MAADAITSPASVLVRPDSLAHCAAMFVQLERMAKPVNRNANAKTMASVIHIMEHACAHQVCLSVQMISDF